jgi:hypothetical protein
LTGGASGVGCGAYHAGAEANAQDLMMSGFPVRKTRVVESDEPVNYRYVDERLESFASAEPALVYPLKVEIHRPRERALASWQSPAPNKYSRSHGTR